MCIRDRVGTGLALTEMNRLDEALAEFDRTGAAFLPVIRPPDPPPPGRASAEPAAEPEILGVVYHIDALRALNRALADTAAEEHG